MEWSKTHVTSSPSYLAGGLRLGFIITMGIPKYSRESSCQGSTAIEFWIGRFLL